MRLALFLGATGIGMILGALISFSLVAALFHLGLNDIQKIISDPQYATAAQLANALASIIAFGLPSLTVAFDCTHFRIVIQKTIIKNLLFINILNISR